MSLDLYEMSGGKISGFKVLKNNQVVGTIEKRDGKWIGAFFKEKIITIVNEKFENVLNEVYQGV